MKNRQKYVIGYIRVSSQEQKEQGISLKAQKEKILQWSALHEYQVLNIFSDEGVSGTKSKRPGLQKALDLACENRAIFVVYFLSRFSRSITDTLKFTSQLQKAGAELVSISEQIDTISAAGKMIFRVLAVLNQFEVEQGGERTKAALDYRRANGLKTGGKLPYGYKVDDKLRLHPDSKEKKIIQTIKTMKDSGQKYAAIARHLNEKGIPAKQGGQWYIQSIKNVLKYESQRSHV